MTGEQIDALLVKHGKGEDGFHSFARALIAAHEAAKPAPDAITNDLAMLVWRMASRLRKGKPDNELAQQAIDFVNRVGLTPSPLR